MRGCAPSCTHLTFHRACTPASGGGGDTCLFCPCSSFLTPAWYASYSGQGTFIYSLYSTTAPAFGSPILTFSPYLTNREVEGVGGKER